LDPEKCLKSPRLSSDRILRFDSRFESGNLASAWDLGGDAYHLILEYDKNNMKSCQWFYFRILNVKRDVKYQFYISGFHKQSSVFCSGSRIFLYSEKRAARKGISWERDGFAYGYGTTFSVDGEKRASLQFQIRFQYNDDIVYMCYAVPYTYSNLLKDIIRWKSSPLFFETILCKTPGGRDCPVLRITSRVQDPSADRRSCIFLTCRVHPGESNSSIMLRGLIDYVLSGTPAAKFLVDSYIILIVPMMCIDGVIEGSYRCDLHGYDLNRVWTKPDQIMHSVVWHTKNLIQEIRRQRVVEAYIDFHGHSQMHGTFMYGCPNDGIPAFFGSEKVLPRIMSVLSQAFSWQKCVFSYPNQRKSCSRIVVRTEMDIVHCFTLESSFGGIPNGPMAGILNDERIWLELGGKVIDGLYHLLVQPFTQLRSYAQSNSWPETEARLRELGAVKVTGKKEGDKRSKGGRCIQRTNKIRLPSPRK
jgi:hypothetical protein